MSFNHQGGERQGPDQEQLCLALWKQKTGSVPAPHLVHPLMLHLTHQKIWHGSQEKQEGSQQRRFRKEPHWVLAFRRQGRCAWEVEVTSTQLSGRTWNQTKVNWCPAQGSLLIPQQTKLIQNFNQLQENPCHSDLNKSEICLLTVTRLRCQGLVWCLVMLSGTQPLLLFCSAILCMGLGSNYLSSNPAIIT